MSVYEPKRDVEQLVSCYEYKNVKAIPHFHRSVELIYVLCGKISAQVDEQIVCAEKDQIIFIPSGYSHSVNSDEGTRSITLIIPYRFFSPFERKGIDLHFINLTNKKQNKQILQHILSIKERVDKQPTLLMQGFVNVVLGLIIENYIPQRIKERKNDLILDIVNYVEYNYTDEITLEKISTYFGYSKYYFSKLFNALFGCTLKSYVNTVRCNAVEVNKENSVSNAVLDAGFNSLSTYYKFKSKNKHIV